MIGINAIIAAFLSLFFWGKTTKDIDEKTKLASKTKTLVYLVLSFVVGIFYYKTCQVATIYNDIIIDGVKESVNPDGQKVDTIEYIDINNKFSSGGVQNRESKAFKEENDEAYIHIGFKVPNGEQYKHVIREDYQDITILEPEYADAENIFGIDVYSNSIPHFYPFLPSVNKIREPYVDKKSEYVSGWTCYFSSDTRPEQFKSVAVGLNDDGKKKIGKKEVTRKDVYCSSTFIAHRKQNDFGYTIFGCKVFSTFSNSLDFFTAADLSQYIHCFNIRSDLPIKKLFLLYDVPVELSIDEPDIYHATQGIIIYNPFLKHHVYQPEEMGPSMPLHIKLPTLANLQLIRSLILTTLLAALVSLFFSNLYLVIRKKALEIKENKIETISEEKVKIFRLKLNILLFILLALIIYITWHLLTDSPLHINQFFFDYNYYIFFIVLIVLALYIYIQFKKAYRIKRKDK